MQVSDEGRKKGQPERDLLDLHSSVSVRCPTIYQPLTESQSGSLLIVRLINRSEDLHMSLSASPHFELHLSPRAEDLVNTLWRASKCVCPEADLLATLAYHLESNLESRSSREITHFMKKPRLMARPPRVKYLERDIKPSSTIS